MKDTSSEQPSSTKRLRRLYILALCTIALFAISGQLLIQYALFQQSSDARVINVAGRQRYLSLKLTMAVCGLIIPSDPIDRDSRIHEVKDTLTSLTQERHGLISGDASLGLPGQNSQEVLSLLNSIEPNFQAISDAVNSMLTRIDHDNGDGIRTPVAELTPSVDVVLAQEEGFATTMNSAVLQYQHEAEDRVNRLRIIEIVLCSLTLCVLVLEGRYVFHPAVKRLEESVKALLQAKTQITTHAEELQHKNNELELAFDEAMVAHRKVMPHARVVALGRYQVQGSRGSYYDVESRLINGTTILECGCPMYSRNMICSHSLAAGSLHSALLRQQDQRFRQSSSPLPFQRENERHQKEG